MERSAAVIKPPYAVPSMAEIAAMPQNGRTVISTFSGAGGSCLGFRMAGFRTLWASEFIPAAAEVYRLNHRGVILDTRDIRTVSGAEILAAIGRSAGDIDVLEGSPPCASFSMSGKREASWGKVVDYSDTRQRVDDLFAEYVRLLREIRPRVFVAENVAGLVRGMARGFFAEIYREFEAAGYWTEARMLDAAYLGVPQERKRVFFIGVRDDQSFAPPFPDPLPYIYTIRDALPHIRRIRKNNEWQSASTPSSTVFAQFSWGDGATAHQGTEFCEAVADIRPFAVGREAEKLAAGQKSGRYYSLMRPHADKASPTITAVGGRANEASVIHPYEQRKFSIAELRRICGFPDDFILTGVYKQQWERLGRAVPPVMMAHVARSIAKALGNG